MSVRYVLSQYVIIALLIQCFFTNDTFNIKISNFGDTRHTLFIMALCYLILALLVQNSITHAQSLTDGDENEKESREILKTKPESDEPVEKDFDGAHKDWMDMFLNKDLYLTPSASLMAQATFCDKSPEEQLEDIKEMANQITKAIQSEIANLLSYAICSGEKDENNNLRKRRSIETPMDSTKLVTRLLKHIKSNNEYQHIAIEKMMSAQEIADKYGVSFSPDTETLSELAVAANEQAREMSEILQDALDLKNVTQSKSIPEKSTVVVENFKANTTHSNKDCTIQIQNNIHGTSEPDISYLKPNNVPEYIPSYNYYYTPIETQIPAPVHTHTSPVSLRPNFYDFISYPTDEYLPYCSLEPVTTTIVLPIDEQIQLEPELIGEEYEETVSSKMVIDEEEPGLSTVNHVMTYTLSEKAHFRTPKIEDLPQQMQYYFFLM